MAGSLKNRMYAHLVEKLMMMTYRRDEQDPLLHHFTGAGDVHIVVKIISQLDRNTDDHGYHVEILTEAMEVLIEETIWPHHGGHEAMFGTTTYYNHPLYELVELTKNGSLKDLDTVRKVGRILSYLS